MPLFHNLSLQSYNGIPSLGVEEFFFLMTQRWIRDATFDKVYVAILQHGATGPRCHNGLRQVAAAFRSMDKNADRLLTGDEFAAGLMSLGVTLSRSDIIYLMAAFDSNRDGRINAQEFVDCLLVRSINPRRRALVEQVWAALRKLSPTKGAAIPLGWLMQRFVADRHPAVLGGIATAGKIVEEFFGMSAPGSSLDANVDGALTRDEFVGFVCGVSATIPDDEIFERCLRGCFDVDGVVTDARLASTQNAATMAVTANPAARPLAACLSPYLQSTGLTKGYNHSHLTPVVNRDERPQGNKQKAAPGEACKWTLPTPTTKATFPAYTASQLRGADQTRSKVVMPASPTGDVAVDRVRARLLARVGAEGFEAVRRCFMAMDKNRDALLTEVEIKKGLERLQVELSPSELARVMSFVDRDRTGKVSVTEFIRTIRGTMSGDRITLIVGVFQRLDTSGNGVIELRELVPRYDTSQHPSVLSGYKTKEEVTADFIGRWDANRDGCVTLSEWVDYYSDISCGIDRDDYFELMLRNAWHISGGIGAAANTTCRRVLCEFRDGRQAVLEIQDDLGVGVRDVDEMRRRLQQAGHTDIERISFAF